MFFVWVVIAGLLQATVLKGLDLLLVMAVFAGLRKGMLGGLLVGAGIGMFAGILSGASFGLILMLYAMTGLMAGIVKTHVYYARLD